MWYTLVRFKDAPQNITGVSQAKTAADALSLSESWEQRFPTETTVVFDPKNVPVSRKTLGDAAHPMWAGPVQTQSTPIGRY